MMSSALFSAVLLFISVLSLAPQAWVCGTVQKHECSCCDGGNACTCCDIVPLYPDQAAASTESARVTPPVAWTPVPMLHNAPAGSAVATGLFAETIHGPPPPLITSQLRI